MKALINWEAFTTIRSTNPWSPIHPRAVCSLVGDSGEDVGTLSWPSGVMNNTAFSDASLEGPHSPNLSRMQRYCYDVVTEIGASCARFVGPENNRKLFLGSNGLEADATSEQNMSVNAIRQQTDQQRRSHNRSAAAVLGSGLRYKDRIFTLATCVSPACSEQYHTHVIFSIGYQYLH